jgi:hypothetical protein
MRISSLAPGLTFALLSVAVAMPPAAEARRWKDRGDYGYVTAESRYGGPSVTAPVRPGPRGQPQVQLPGGTWIDCGRSCSDTLRRETVDFWQSRGPFGPDGPGYLRFRF